MKFRTLVIITNIVFFIVFVTLFVFPVFYFDFNAIKQFWQSNFLFIFIFFAVFALVQYILFRNKRIVDAIESQDWPALAMHLEQVIFEKKRVSFKNVKLLLETLFLLSDFSTVEKLEQFLLRRKPNFVADLAREFAAIRFISKQYDSLQKFCTHQNLKKNPKDEWLLFFSAMTHLSLKQYSFAKNIFLELLENNTQGKLRIMTLYVCLHILPQSTLTQIEKNTLRSLYDSRLDIMPAEQWYASITSSEATIYEVIFSSLFSQISETFY